MLFVIAAGGHIVLENPGNSMVTLHARYVQLLKMLLKVGLTDPGLWWKLFSCAEVALQTVQYIYWHSLPFFLLGLAKTDKVAMWMRKFASFTWKRTWLWSTSPEIHRLDLGPMTSSEKETQCSTTTRSVNKNGKVFWTGNANLKPTQFPGSGSTQNC